MPTRNGQIVSLYDEVQTDEQDYWAEPSLEYTPDRDYDEAKPSGSVDYGHPRTRPTYWSLEGEQAVGATKDDTLRASKEKRFRELEEDRKHPASPYYGYSTPGDDRTRGRVKQAPLVRLVLNQFQSRPSYVTEDLVRDRIRHLADRIEIPSNYGGYRLLVVVALLDTWGLSNEDAYQHEQFRTELRREFFEAEPANQDSQGALFRKIVEIRNEVQAGGDGD